MTTIIITVGHLNGRGAVPHCFYKHRVPAIFQRHGSRFLSDLSDCKNVISIDANRVDAVSNAAARNTIATILFQR